jgi:hypothetical protein
VQEVNHTLRKLLQFLYLTRKFKHHLDDVKNRDLLKAAHYLVQLGTLPFTLSYEFFSILTPTTRKNSNNEQYTHSLTHSLSVDVDG